MQNQSTDLIYYIDPKDDVTLSHTEKEGGMQIAVFRKKGGPIYTKNTSISILHQASPIVEKQIRDLHSFVLGRQKDTTNEWFYQELILRSSIQEERFSKLGKSRTYTASYQKHVFGRIFGILHPKMNTLSLTAIQVENTQVSIQRMVDYLLRFSEYNLVSIRTDTRDFNTIIKSLKNSPDNNHVNEEVFQTKEKIPERFNTQHFSSLDGKIFFTRSDEEMIQILNSSIHVTSYPTHYLEEENSQKWWYFEGQYHGRFRCKKTGMRTKKDKVITQIYGIEHEENIITLTSIRIPHDYESLKALETDIQTILNHPIYIIKNEKEVSDFLMLIRTERNKISRP